MQNSESILSTSKSQPDSQTPEPKGKFQGGDFSPLRGLSLGMPGLGFCLVYIQHKLEHVITLGLLACPSACMRQLENRREKGCCLKVGLATLGKR